jgi:hypothetical protein
MAKWKQRQWGIRERIRRDGVNINVAADVNVVATEGGGASNVQRTRIVQSSKARAQGRSQEKVDDEENAMAEQSEAREDGLSHDELAREVDAEELPDREQMSLVNANVAVPINAAIAANVLSDGAVAYADATQDANLDQSN